MNIGRLTATLGLNAQDAINNMTHFERVMVTLVNKIDSTLERMEASMAGVTGAAIDMRNKSVAGFTATANAAKVATVATTQYTTAVVAANAATKVSPVSVGKAKSAISQSAITNSTRGISAVNAVATNYNVSPMVAKDAINQTLAVARENAKQVASFNKMHSQAIAMDNKRTAIVNANRIKEAYAEADAASKRIMSFNKMHQQAINEDNKRTKIAQANEAKIAAAQQASSGKYQAGLMQMTMGLRSFGWLATTVFTAPIIMFGKSIIQAGMDFEFTLKKMIGLAGVAKDSIGQISKEVKKISSETGVNPQKVTESYYFVASSGIKKAADVLKITEMAAKGAASGMGEVTDIAKLLTSAMNAYAAEGLKVNTIMDTLTATIRVGKAEPAEMVNAFGTILPIAEKLGLDMQDVGGALATMTLITNSTATSATYLRNVLMKLLDPTPQVRDAMVSMGISMEQIHALLKTPDGFIKTMELLGTTTEKYGVTMDAIFPEMRSLLGALNFTGEGLKRLKENTEEVNKSSGDFQKHLSEMSTTMQMRWNKAIADSKNAMIDLGATVATAILPMLEKLVAKLTSVITWFESLSEGSQQMVLRIVAFAAAIGPICLVLATFGSAIGNVWGWVMKLGGGNTSAFGLLNISLRSLPWVAVGVGLIKLIGWFSDQHDAALKAQEATAKLNESLVAVGGTMKSLGSLGIADYSSMTFGELSDTRNTAFNDAKKAVDEYNKLEELRKQNPRHDKAYDTLEDPYIVQFRTAQKVYQETGKYLTEYANNVDKTTVSTKKGTIVNLEAAEALKRLNEAWAEAELKTWKATFKPNIPKPIQGYQKGMLGVSQPLVKGLSLTPQSTGAEQRKVMDELAFSLDYINIKENALNKTLGTSRGLFESSTARINAYSTALEGYLAVPVTERGLAWSEGIADTITQLGLLQKEFDKVAQKKEIFNIISNGIMNMATAIGGAVTGIRGAWTGIVDVIIGIAQQLIAVLLAAAAAAIIAGETIKGLGIPGLIIGAIGVGALAALWANTKGNMSNAAQLANGGIIPSGYPNDTYPALLTSGETVLPKSLNGAAYSNKGGKVIFEIEGRKLVGILQDMDTYSKSY